MTPEISEFSYGFALTNEIVGWGPLAVAPVFPSLIEEGKEGGGYDVKLELPGIPLFLQFKRADRMTRRSAREISKYGARLSVPYHRFHITEKGKSDQHELLLSLEESPNLVFYAAPRFHSLAEINSAWAANTVATRSIFVAPRDIGPLGDESHCVAYDGRAAWLCSEPRTLRPLSSRDLLEKLQADIAADPRPFRAKIEELVADVEASERRAVERIRERRRASASAAKRQAAIREAALEAGLSIGVDALTGGGPIQTAPSPSVDASSFVSEPIPIRDPRPLDDARRGLRTVADLAGRLFNAQLVVVQPRA